MTDGSGFAIHERAPAWIVGTVASAAGAVPRVATSWSGRDCIEHLRCRIGSYRNRYSMPSGLYAVGSPGANSEVFVTANYKMSFDHLRRGLDGLDAWILVLDTRGVNVWCAAGKGTFGTEELARRVESVGLARVVTHRRLIVPQLGAPGVSAHEVQRLTGFRVRFGPVRASDIAGYLRTGLEPAPDMRRVRFGLADRVVLVPMELVPALKALLGFAAAVLLLSGLGSHGFSLARAASAGVPVAGLGLVAVVSGAVVTPILLPLVPGRAFAWKGALVGAALTAGYAAFVPAVFESGRTLAAFAWVFAPAVSSYLALQFTGSTTFSSMSGVKKELRFALPIHAMSLAVAVAMLVAHQVLVWGGP
jgi:acetyl-CoA decarbonylase/synthase complex subunit gamma